LHDIGYFVVENVFFSSDDFHRFVERVLLPTHGILLCFGFNPDNLDQLGVFFDRISGRVPASLESGTDLAAMVVGTNAALLETLHLAKRYAAYDVTVLITGETGTGKDVVARYIHRHSARADRPFVACSLASIPETLVESELFGYAKGAFTGAEKNREGFLEAARGGTLFLDEIGDLTPSLQVKLLRLLENHEYYRLGESTPRQADVRIIAATNRDLEADMVEKRFRHDLYYRLNGARIMVPALRERKEDIPALTAHFLELASVAMKERPKEPSSAVSAALLDYSWPGNIRELKNVMESAAMVSDQHFLLMSDLPMQLQRHAVQHRDVIGARAMRKIDEAELHLIQRTLQMTHGDKKMAARQLGISTRTLYRKLVKLTDQTEPYNGLAC